VTTIADKVAARIAVRTEARTGYRIVPLTVVRIVVQTVAVRHRPSSLERKRRHWRLHLRQLQRQTAHQTIVSMGRETSRVASIDRHRTKIVIAIRQGQRVRHRLHRIRRSSACVRSVIPQCVSRRSSVSQGRNSSRSKHSPCGRQSRKCRLCPGRSLSRCRALSHRPNRRIVSRRHKPSHGPSIALHRRLPMKQRQRNLMAGIAAAATVRVTARR
jgi:hypothetical protein